MIRIVLLIAASVLAGIALVSAIILGIFTIAGAYNYIPITTIRDKNTGFYVELGVTKKALSADNFLLYIFKDNEPREGVWFFNWPPIFGFSESGVIGTPTLAERDGCYILDVQEESERKPLEIVWKDSDTGATICFRKTSSRPAERR